MKRWLVWLLDHLFERHDIGRGNDVYLTRWVVFGKRFESAGSKVFLHQFRRSDADFELHNHPWSYWSLIIWRGYWEYTPTTPDEALISPQVGRWYGPLSLLRRPATWKHRVELHEGREAWTLIWCGPKVRSWGFWCGGDWVPWRQFVERQEAGQHGCGD